jgi:hypothetical protein
MSNIENVGRELSDAELSAVHGGLFGFIKDAANAVADAVGDAASAVGGAIGDAASAVGGAIADGARAIGRGFHNMFMAETKRRLRQYGAY